MSPAGRAAAALALAAMGGCNNPCPNPQPSITPMANNTILDFSSTPSKFTCEDDFTWQNSAGQANLSFANSALTAGTVQVSMLDAHGQIVMGTPTSAADDGGFVQGIQGAPGAWTVQIVYTSATGVVNMVATQVAAP